MSTSKAKTLSSSASKKRKRVAEDSDSSFDDAASSARLSSDEGDDDRHVSTSESELAEAKRLKALAYSAGLLLPSSSSSSSSLTSSTAVPIPPSLFPYSNVDIENKSASRANARFLCVFPGQFRVLPDVQAAIKAQADQERALNKAASGASGGAAGPTPEASREPEASITGRIGSISGLDTRNPVVVLDFPQGQLLLRGTIVYPEALKLIALTYSTRVGKKIRPLTSRGTFDHFIVFSEWSWKSRGGQAEDGAREEAIPAALLRAPIDVQQQSDGAALSASQHHPSTQQPLSDGDHDGYGEEEEEEEERRARREEVDVLSDDGADGSDGVPRSTSRRPVEQSAPKRRRRALDDDDDSEAEMDEPEDREVQPASRPQRARKQINYAVDVEDSAEEEEEEVEDEDNDAEEGGVDEPHIVDDDDDENGDSDENSRAQSRVSSVKPKKAAPRTSRRDSTSDEEDEDDDDNGDDDSGDGDYED